MYNAPTVLATSLSIGHHGVMPVVVEEGDAIILDQQVHSSVQDATRKIQSNGVYLTIIRHNDLKELKAKIEELSEKYNKVWYMCDGVYSMYGDVAPLEELFQLADQYKKFHLYIDDAHGMSVFGKHGTGFVMNQTGLHPKMVLCTGMAKGFGTIGGIYVIPDQELAVKVRNCAGPLIFSGQQATCILASSIASAKIHLSDEIRERQSELEEKIKYCRTLLRKYKLPDISDPRTPVFFVGLGMMSVGFNLVKRMLNEGFFMNIAAFPAVPETCTGIRFTITHHLTYADITKMVQALAKQFPLALKEEGRSVRDIQRAFRRIAELDYLSPEKVKVLDNRKNYKYQLHHETCIDNIPKEVWNSLLGSRGIFDWNGLKLLEKVFKSQSNPENNWQFHYYLVTDKQKKPLLATFFTVTVTKDDMLAPISISEQIEEVRIKDPYFLTSKAMTMGSSVTEGDHLYIDRSHSGWQQVLMLLLDTVMEEYERQGCEMLLLRDFKQDDQELSEFLIQHGFIRTTIPDTHILSDLDWDSKEIFLNKFHKHRRQYLKKKVFKYENYFNVSIEKADSQSIDHWYRLYENVRKKSFEINTFSLPKKFFEEIAENSSWEVIQLKLKSEFDFRAEKLPTALMFCYKTPYCYCPIFVGVDYQFKDYNIYPQILWQTILRAKEVKAPKINLGFTASQNKQKFGAVPVQQVAFIQLKDHYKMMMIGLMPNKAA